MLSRTAKTVKTAKTPPKPLPLGTPRSPGKKAPEITRAERISCKSNYFRSFRACHILIREDLHVTKM